jgi:hypothetical protein
MTLPLLSLLRQSRTELKLAKHAGCRATARLKAAMAVYNWCAHALVGMKKWGDGYDFTFFLKARKGNSANWDRTLAMCNCNDNGGGHHGGEHGGCCNH